MAGLAGLALQKGYTVTGQDKAYFPPMSNQLITLGIKENKTEEPTDDLKNSDMIIVGNALSRGNKSVEYVLDNNLKYYSGPEWIKKNILQDKYVFVVSGTHGKTTTTSMLIKILQENNKNPSFLVGGIYKDENISYKYTNSDYFIIEGDEYDTSFFDKRSKFFHYKPNTLIINNLEYDHSDIFESIEQIKKQFHFLIRTMPKDSNIIYNSDDKNIISLLSMGCWSQNKSYKIIKNITNIFGDHNIRNASASIAAANAIGINESDSIKALEKFIGVKRRLELIDCKKFILYDDFAHHPTAISSTIKAVKSKYPGKNITVIFEARSNSMLSGTHKKVFMKSFDDAEELYVYCQKDIAWLEKDLGTRVFKDTNIIVEKISDNIDNVDIVIVMSNGDTTDIINKLIKI